MVIARELTRALREAGHDAHIIVTPQNALRPAGVGLPRDLADRRHLDRRAPIDQVISLRYPSYAVRHRRHVCWLNHTMREYYDLWDVVQRHAEREGAAEGARPEDVHSRGRSVSADARVAAVRAVEDGPAADCGLAVGELDGPVSSGAARAPTAATATATAFLFVSRLTALKRADLLIRALATPAASPIRW